MKEFTDLTLQDVKDFLATAEAKMPRVMQWRQQTLNETIQNNEIRSPLLGRRQTFPLGRVEPTVAYNFKAQSGGADLWALGALKFMQKWDQWEDDARLVQNGHDSILIVAKEEIADQVAKDVEECWSTTWNDVPFLMESAVGHRWSDT